MSFCFTKATLKNVAQKYKGPEGAIVDEEFVRSAAREAATRKNDRADEVSDEDIMAVINERLNPSHKIPISYRYAALRQALADGNKEGASLHDIAKSIESNLGTHVLGKIGIVKYYDPVSEKTNYVWHDVDAETFEQAEAKMMAQPVQYTGEEVLSQLKEWSKRNVKYDKKNRAYSFNGIPSTRTASSDGDLKKPGSSTVHTKMGNVVDSTVRELARLHTDGKELLSYEDMKKHLEENTRDKESLLFFTEKNYNLIREKFDEMVEHYNKVFDGKEWGFMSEEIRLATAVPIFDGGKMRLEVVSGTPDLIIYTKGKNPEFHVVDIKTTKNGLSDKNLQYWSSQTNYYVGMLTSINPNIGPMIKGTGVFLIETEEVSTNSGGNLPLQIKENADGTVMITNTDGLEMRRDGNGFKTIATRVRFKATEPVQKIQVDKAERVMTYKEMKQNAMNLAVATTEAIQTIKEQLQYGYIESGSTQQQLKSILDRLRIGEEHYDDIVYALSDIQETYEKRGNIQSAINRNYEAVVKIAMLLSANTNQDPTAQMKQKYILDHVGDFIAMQMQYHKEINGVKPFIEEISGEDGFDAYEADGVLNHTEEGLELNEEAITGGDQAVNSDEVSIEKIYGMDYKTVEQSKSMPARLKYMFSSVQIDGEISDSSSPMEDKISMNYVFTTLRSHLNNASTLSEMMERMDRLSETIPWVKQIGERLEMPYEDESDIEHQTLKSMFFVEMKRNQAKYSEVKTKEGYYGPRSEIADLMSQQVANRHAQAVKQSIGDKKNVLFESKYAGSKAAIATVKEGAVDYVSKAHDKAREYLKKYYSNTVDRTEVVDWLYKTYQDIGLIEVSREDIAMMLSSGGSRVLANIRKEFEDIGKKLSVRSGAEASNIFSYNKDVGKKNNEKYGFYRNYQNLVSMVREYVGDTTERSIMSGGKSYQTYTQQSFLGKLFESLSGEGQSDSNKVNYNGEKISERKAKIRTFIDERFGSDSYRTEVNGERRLHNAWLRAIHEGSLSAETHQQLSMDGVSYRDMSRRMYGHSVLMEFFGGDIMAGTQVKQEAFFAVPIISDKPASEFIKGIAYFGDDALRDNIMPEMIDLAKYEVKRLRNLIEQARDDIDTLGYNEAKRKAIKNFNVVAERAEIDRIISSSDSDTNKLMAIMSLGNIGLHFTPNFVQNLERLSVENEVLAEEFSKGLLNMIFRERSEPGNINQEAYQRILELAIEDEVKTLKGDIGLLKYEFYGDNTVNGEFIGIKSLDPMRVAKSMMAESEIKMLDELIANRNFKQAQEVMREKIDEFVNKKLSAFVMNNINGSAQIMNMLITDPMYYSGPVDIQKRMAQIHAPFRAMDTSAMVFDVNPATGQYEARPASDGKHRVLYITDTKSSLTSEIEAAIDEVYDDLIRRSKTEELKRAYEERRKAVKESIKDGDSADGQGFSTPSAMRKKLVMAGMWSEQKESVYQKVMKGEKLSDSDIKLLTQPTKPFTYSSEAVSVGGLDLTLQTQIKDSEYMLHAMLLTLARGSKINPKLKNLIDFVESTHKDAQGFSTADGIDTIVFSSAVKVGAHNVMSLEEFSSPERTKALLDGYNQGNKYIHELEFSDYGYQQTVSSHYQDHKNLDGSQKRALIYAGIDPLDPIEINGQEMTVEQARREYGKTYQELIKMRVDKFLEEISPELMEGERKDSQSYIRRKNQIISNMVKQHMMSQFDYNPEIASAFDLNEYGDFRIPLNEGMQSIKVQQLFYSIIKDRVFKQKVQGGALVQVSSESLSDELQVKFKKDKNGNTVIDHFEAAMPVPNAKLEKALTLPDGTLMSPQEAIDKGIITPDMLESIAYRIPTENKYSMAPLRIVKFLPRVAGDAVMLPKQIVSIAGSDFDIDKLYVAMRKISYEGANFSELSEQQKESIIDRILGHKKLSNLLATNSISKSQVRKLLEGKADHNIPDAVAEFIMQKSGRVKAFRLASDPESQLEHKLLDYQLGAMRTKSATESMFLLGNFDKQKDAGYKAHLLKSGKYSVEEVQAMSSKELKQAFEATQNKPLSLLSSNIYFKQQNSTGSTMIGIFANYNVGHATMSALGLEMNFHGSLSNMEIAGVRLGANTPLDALYSRNGVSKILDELSTYVMAATDTAKTPSLALMGITPTTAKYAGLFIRLGMSTEDVAMILSNPYVEKAFESFDEEKALTGRANINTIIEEMITEAGREMPDGSNINNPLRAAVITKANLMTAIQDKTMSDTSYKLLLMMKDLGFYANQLNDATYIAKFNSQSNAPGPSMVDAMASKEKVRKFALDESNRKKKVFNNRISLLIPASVARSVGMEVDYSEDRAYIPNEFYERSFGDDSIEKALFGDNFIYNSYGYTKIKNELAELVPYTLTTKTLEKLATDLTLFAMTQGDTKDSRVLNLSPERVMYLTTDKYVTPDGKSNKAFLTLFQEMKASIQDNVLMNASYIDNVNSDGLPTVRVDFKGMDISQQQMLGDAWLDLLNNPKTKQFAIELWEHFALMGGFAYNPKTAMHLMPNKMKEMFTAYLGRTREIGNFITRNIDNGDSLRLFLEQFIRNNADDSSIVYRVWDKHSKKLNINKGNDGSLTISEKNGEEYSYRRLFKNDGEPMRYINYNGDLYELQSQFDGLSYKRLGKLGSFNTYKEYNFHGSFGEPSYIQKSSDNAEMTDLYLAEEDRVDSVYSEIYQEYESNREEYETDPGKLLSFAAEKSNIPGMNIEGLLETKVFEGDKIARGEGESLIDVLQEALIAIIETGDFSEIKELRNKYC